LRNNAHNKITDRLEFILLLFKRSIRNGGSVKQHTTINERGLGVALLPCCLRVVAVAFTAGAK
jgi:hypothetical protein